jgi:TPR repeat protein
MAHSLQKAFRLIESRPATKVIDGYSLLLREILRGDVGALDALGSMLTYGVGTGMNPCLPVAAACYAAASRASHPGATYNLATVLIEGAGITKDVRRGLRLLRAADRAGILDARNYLGYCYRVGRGVSRNARRGFQLTLQAARAGAATAQYDAGMCLLAGTGVRKDRDAAVTWLSRAAQKGDRRAQEYLAKRVRRRRRR